MSITHGDGFAALAALPADSAALVFCDPDWGILEMTHEGDYKPGESPRETAADTGRPLWWDTTALLDTIREGLRVATGVMLKLSGKACHVDTISRRLCDAPADRFAWDKGPGAPGWANDGIAGVPETLWWFTRDGRRAQRRTAAEWKMIQAIVRVRKVRATARLTAHPLEMPQRLCEWIVCGFTAPGDRIVDVCAGSGALGVAALRLGREYAGWETDEKWVAQSRAALVTARPLKARHTGEIFPRLRGDGDGAGG